MKIAVLSLLFACLCFGRLAFASDAPNDLLNSDPNLAYKASLEQTLAFKDADPFERQQSIAYQLLDLADQTGHSPSDPALLDRLQKIYRQLKNSPLVDRYLEFSIHYANLLLTVKTRQESLVIIHELLEVARKHDKPSIVLSGLELLMLSTNGKSELHADLLRYTMELQEFIKSEKRLGEEEKLEAQLRLSTYNNNTLKGDHKVLFERTIQLALEQGRYRRASAMLAEQAVSMMSAEPMDVPAIEKILDRALTIARKDKLPYVEKNILEYQAFFSNIIGRFDQALALVDQTLRLTHPQDFESLVNIYREQEMAFIGLKQYGKGLKVIEEMKRIMPDTMKGVLVGVSFHEASAYEGLKQYKEALEAYQRFHELYASYKDKEADEQFAKASANIGLDVESQQRVILEKENELQAAKLATAKYLKIAAVILAVLLLVAVCSLGFAHWQMKLVKISRSKMKDILDLIEEGIVMIRPDLQAEPIGSRYLGQIYPDFYAEGPADAIDKLFPPSQVGAETHSMCRQSMQACLSEDILAWELNQEHFPREMRLKLPDEKLLTYHWQPVLDEQQKVKSFLLAIRDVTKERQLEIKLAQEQERVHRLQRKVQEMLSGRFHETRSLLERLSPLIKSKQNPASFLDMSELKHQLHTAKGEARTLGLKTLSQAIHVLESALVQPTAESWQGAWDGLMTELNEYQYLIRDVLALPGQQAERDRSLLDITGGLLPQLKQHLATAQVPLAGVWVDDRIQDWTADLLLAARSMLIHAITNAADHGYIYPRQRGELLDAARFEVTAERLHGDVLITVADSGVGLNLPKLAQMAKEKGFIPDPNRSVSDVLFYEGLSTAEQLTETSGRGVGLAAVRAICQQWKGEAWIGNRPKGRGAMLSMRLNVASRERTGANPAFSEAG